MNHADDHHGQRQRESAKFGDEMDKLARDSGRQIGAAAGRQIDVAGRARQIARRRREIVAAGRVSEIDGGAFGQVARAARVVAGAAGAC